MRVDGRTERSSAVRWLRLYPRAWRERYGDELRELTTHRPIDWRTRLDLIRGAVDAHLHPIDPPRIGVVTPLLAGLAWIVAGGITLLEPAPPDWPGYLAWTLPIGLIGAISSLRMLWVVGRRSGLRGPVATGQVVLAAAAFHVLWIGALIVAIAGGPYGAPTAASQSLAAAGTVGVGVLRSRAGDHPVAEALLIAGGAMLVPAPATWIIVGIAWLSTLLAGSGRRHPRPA